MSISDYQNEDGTLDPSWRDEFDECETLEEMEDFFEDRDPIGYI